MMEDGHLSMVELHLASKDMKHQWLWSVLPPGVEDKSRGDRQLG